MPPYSLSAIPETGIGVFPMVARFASPAVHDARARSESGPYLEE
jgi:hypothetical protein